MNSSGKNNRPPSPLWLLEERHNEHLQRGGGLSKHNLDLEQQRHHLEGLRAKGVEVPGVEAVDGYGGLLESTRDLSEVFRRRGLGDLVGGMERCPNSRGW